MATVNQWIIRMYHQPTPTKATEGIIRVTNLVQQWQQCNKLVCHLPSQTMATMDKTRVTIITNLFHDILKWQP